jgi:hypothetical protein
MPWILYWGAEARAPKALEELRDATGDDDEAIARAWRGDDAWVERHLRPEILPDPAIETVAAYRVTGWVIRRSGP